MYEKIRAALNAAESFENFEFTVDGIKCFVGRNLYPVTAFSCGCAGCSTTLYGFPVGAHPNAETIAREIAQCIRTRPTWIRG